MSVTTAARLTRTCRFFGTFFYARKYVILFWRSWTLCKLIGNNFCVIFPSAFHIHTSSCRTAAIILNSLCKTSAPRSGDRRSSKQAEYRLDGHTDAEVVFAPRLIMQTLYFLLVLFTNITDIFRVIHSYMYINVSLCQRIYLQLTSLSKQPMPTYATYLTLYTIISIYIIFHYITTFRI